MRLRPSPGSTHCERGGSGEGAEASRSSVSPRGQLYAGRTLPWQVFPVTPPGPFPQLSSGLSMSPGELPHPRQLQLLPKMVQNGTLRICRSPGQEGLQGQSQGGGSSGHTE